MLKAYRLCVSLNSRLESNKEEERRPGIICSKVDTFCTAHQDHQLENSPFTRNDLEVEIGEVERSLVQEYLAHKKLPPHRTLQ